MPSVGIVASAVQATPPPPDYTEALLEPFDNLTKWTSLTLATIVGGGRTGNMLNLASGGVGSHIYTLFKREDVTCGFAYKTASLAAARNICQLRTGGTNNEMSFTVTTGGAIEVRRGGTGSTVFGTTATGLVVAATWVYVEIKARCHDTTGSVIIRTNGVERLNLTNVDTKFGATVTELDAICLTGGAAVTNYDDMYVSTGPDAPFKGSITIP